MTSADAPSVKVLLLGQSGVGKSSLMLRFADGTFNPEQAATIGVDFRVKQVDVDGVGAVKLQVWDTAGQERFRTLTKSYYRGASAIVFVHDVAAPETLENVRHWMDEADAYCAGRGLVKLLVSNKVDALEAGTPEDAEARESATRFARENRMLHFFCSAKTSEGVGAAFDEVAAQVTETDEFKAGLASGTSVFGGAGQNKPACAC
jgi:Ras-related protein Rab-18